MNFDFIKYEEKNNVAHVVLNRPDLHNAFNEKFISEITDVFLSINKKSHLRLCILKTSGTHFCAGADLNWMKSMASYTQAENEKDAKKLQDMFLAIDDLNIPLSRIEHAGATILFPKTSIGENGFMAHFIDTEGNRVALHSMK